MPDSGGGKCKQRVKRKGVTVVVKIKGQRCMQKYNNWVDEANGGAISILQSRATRAERREKRFRKRFKKYQKRTKTAKQYAAIDRLTEVETLAASPTQNFYRTREWAELRYKALKELGTVCMLCGASPKTGAQIHVDHILPRSIFPEKALKMDNLQILCRECNMGKSNKDCTDWRL